MLEVFLNHYEILYATYWLWQLLGFFLPLDSKHKIYVINYWLQIVSFHPILAMVECGIIRSKIKREVDFIIIFGVLSKAGKFSFTYL